MKTESVRKVMRVSSALLMGIAICVSVWFLLREHEARELERKSRDGIAAENQNFSQLVQNSSEEPPTKEERVARQARSTFMSSFNEEQLTLPHFQKILETMEAPEYVELPGNLSTREWKDFLESKGVPVTRGNPGIFTDRVPFSSLADYEPVVRQKLAELFVAAESADLTDPMAAALQRGKVLIELDETDENGLAWFMERFGDDWHGAIVGDVWNGDIGAMGKSNPALEWLTDVQRNAVSIVAAAEQARADALEASAPSWDMSSIMGSPPAHPDGIEENLPSVAAPSMDADEQYDAEKRTTATPMVNTEKGVSDVLPSPSEPLPGDEVETALREQFSPARFERAMSMLERYGSEEGLRRLRKSDPEIAKQVEKARYHNRREDTQ